MSKVDEISKMRGSKQIGVEDFIFLLRKEPAKLRRMINFLKVKDIKPTSLVESDEDGIFLSDTNFISE